MRAPSQPHLASIAPSKAPSPIQPGLGLRPGGSEGTLFGPSQEANLGYLGVRKREALEKIRSQEKREKEGRREASWRT